VAATVRLGRYGFGKSIGALSLHEKYPTNLLCTPQVLDFRYAHGTNNPDCEVIRVGNAIRQIRAPEGYANVVSNAPYSYSIEIYSSTVCSTNKDVNGLYTFSGAPLATIVIANPDTSCLTSNKLSITDGDGVVSNYEWKTNGWELVHGGGLRIQQKSTEFTNDLRIVTLDTRGTNGLVTCSIKTYQSNAFGETMIRDVIGVGTDRRTNSFVYHTNTAYRSKGHLMQAEYADGGWVFHEYHTNGLRTNTYSAFLNYALSTNPATSRSMELRYGSNAVPGATDRGRQRAFEPRCVVEYVEGREIARTYKLYLPMERREIYCAVAGAEWNNSSNLVRTYKYYSNGVNKARLLSVEHANGVMEMYQYTYHTNAGGEAFVTNVVMKGQPDGYRTNIVDGSRLVSILGRFGQLVTVTETDIISGITNFVEFYSDYDAYNRPRKITYMDGTFSWKDSGCCGAETVTNREGTVITYLRDNMKRKTGTKQNGITTTNVLDAAGNIVRTIRIGSNGTQIVQQSASYDTTGRMVASTNALGAVTSYSETITNYQKLRTTTYPDGSTRVELYYRDGQLAKITGTAVHPLRYEYGTEQDGGIWRLYSKEIKLDAAGSDTSEWSKTYNDMLGRNYKTVYSDGATRESFYNIKGQLVKTVDPDGVTTLYAYNAKGEQSIVATDVNRDGIVSTNGTDRIQQTVRSVVNNGSANVQRVATYVWSTNNIATSNLLGMADTSVDGLISWNSRYGLTNQSRTKYAGGGTRYSTNTASDGSQSISHYANGLLQNVTRKNSAGTQLSRVDYFYDEHGRQYAATDARNGTTFYTYNDADRVVATTTPPPGKGASAQTTTYEHDWAGRVSRTVLPDGTSVTNEYHPTGELKKTYGSRNYPVQYAYDPQGRRTNMITWKTFATDSGKATTAWRYDGYRGFLTNKVYDDGKGPFYSYTPGGRLRTRTWARGTVTTYHTNSVGEIFATTYSDTTPAVTNNFDRLGRSTNIVDGSGSRFLAYNATGQLLGETNSSGEMIGQNLRFTYDQYQRRTNHAWYATNTSLLSHSFMFDGASRITNVTDGTYQGGYSYLANSPLISQVTYRSNTTSRMTTAKTYDYLNRLQNITSTPGASGESAVSFDYAYNDANQRTRVNLDDGSFWIYEYDKLGQVVSGKRYWSDWTPVAGQQYEYAFDDIGNRTSTKAGGDDAGGALRSASYTANSLNQYTSRDVPAYLNVLGIANANASVTVNSQSAYRKGEYFWKELSANNASAALWQSVTNIASLTGTNQTNTGNLFLTKTAEAYTYDLDGNLTSDGRWTNKWDAENRLIDMTSHSSGPSGSRKSLQFAYDSQGRRYSKVVSNWTGSAWTRVLHEKFLYDGWNLLGAFNGTNAAIIRSFLWGLDLSGSMQGAGGVGGLIAFRQHSGSLAGSHFAAYDGNGNVMALVDGRTGSASARYEYDPFGQTIRASDTMATVNPVRFSSKVVDDETDYAYYGYRYLNPNAGRWLNRDPLGDEVFLRARLLEGSSSPATLLRESKKPGYAFVSNDAINRVDRLGLTQSALTPDEVSACQANINRALDILRKAINLPCGRCRNFFGRTSRCNNLLDRLNSLTVSIDNDPNSATCDGKTYGYTYGNDGRWQVWMCARTCREGRWCLGASIIHELFHECNDDVGGGAHNDDAFAAERACGFNGVCP